MTFTETNQISTDELMLKRRNIDRDSSSPEEAKPDSVTVLPKILLVDDRSDIRRLVRITLGKSFEVFEAEDGTSALEVVRQHRPAVVVLDIMMPGELDGMQVLDVIKADASLASTRVIMVTARGQVQDYESGMQRGADAYFIKPFSPLQLVASIKEILAR